MSISGLMYDAAEKTRRAKAFAPAHIASFFAVKSCVIIYEANERNKKICRSGWIKNDMLLLALEDKK